MLVDQATKLLNTPPQQHRTPPQERYTTLQQRKVKGVTCNEFVLPGGATLTLLTRKILSDGKYFCLDNITDWKV